MCMIYLFFCLSGVGDEHAKAAEATGIVSLVIMPFSFARYAYYMPVIYVRIWFVRERQRMVARAVAYSVNLHIQNVLHFPAS